MGPHLEAREAGDAEVLAAVVLRRGVGHADELVHEVADLKMEEERERED